MAGHDKGSECGGSTLRNIICTISLMLIQEALAVNRLEHRTKVFRQMRSCRAVICKFHFLKTLRLSSPGYVVLELKRPVERSVVTVER